MDRELQPAKPPPLAERSQSGGSGMSDAVRGMEWADGAVPTPPDKGDQDAKEVEAQNESMEQDASGNARSGKGNDGEATSPDVSEFDPFAASRTKEEAAVGSLSATSASTATSALKDPNRPPSPPPSASKPSQPVVSSTQAIVPPGAAEPTPEEHREPRRMVSGGGAAWTQLFGGLRNSVGRGRSESASGGATPPVLDEKEAMREKATMNASTPMREPAASGLDSAPGSAGSSGPFASLSNFASALKRPLVTPSPPSGSPNPNASGSGSSTPRPPASRSMTPRNAASRLTLLPPTPGSEGSRGKALPGLQGEKEPFTPIRGEADHDPTPSVPGGTPQGGSGSGKGRGDDGDGEQVLPFDFNRFLEQMRARGAEPVGKYLRSFLKEFQKRSMFTVGEQIRVINDFLDFISVKMREIPDGPWHPSACSEAEFDNAVEAMEKLVMNRLWQFTYTPALPSYMLPSATDDIERDTVLSQKMRLFAWITEDNLDLDLSGRHGHDIGPSNGGEKEGEKEEPTALSRRDPGVEGFLEFAKTELLKINAYKAPRDKMICVLNCCKVIFGLIRHLNSTEGADTFIPILILVVLKAAPEQMISNLQYIQRFRNPDKLQGESGYYLSSLSAAVSFIEKMDHSALSNITQTEFERNVEAAILTLPKSTEPTPELVQPSAFEAASRTPHNAPSNPSRLDVTPASTPSRSRSPLPSGRRSPQPPGLAAAEGESAADIQPNVSFPDATKAWFQRMPDLAERAVSKPLNAIAKIVDDLAGIDEDQRDPRYRPPQHQQQYPGNTAFPQHTSPQQQQYLPPYHPQYTTYQGSAGATSAGASQHVLGRRTSNASVGSAGRRGTRTWSIHSLDQVQSGLTPAVPVSPPGSTHSGSTRPPRSRNSSHLSNVSSTGAPHPSTPLSDPAHRGAYVPDSVDPAAVQGEMERRDRLSRAQHEANLETLKSIFPSLEREVLEVVLVTNEEQMGKTIDALLEMSAGGEAASST